MACSGHDLTGEGRTSGGTALALGAALITVLAILVGVLAATGDGGATGRRRLVRRAGRSHDDPVPGCAEVHGAGGVRVAVCGFDPQLPDEIGVIAPDGSSRRLSGRADDHGGHWRWAVPSPDGRWVLAQWSGECEVPVAYPVEVTSGERRPVVGEGAETMGVGWTRDGRAVVGLWPGSAASGGMSPGCISSIPPAVPAAASTPITRVR